MLTLKVEYNNSINLPENEDSIIEFAKIYVYQKNEDKINTLCEFIILDETSSSFNPVIKNNKYYISFNDTNGNISLSLENNKFTTLFSTYGGYASGLLKNTFDLTDDENKQFTEEIMKFF